MTIWMLLSGCKWFDDLGDQVDGLTDTTVLGGLFLGIEAPADPRIDLSGTDFEPGATAQLFLADAADPGDLENSPVTGARAGFRSSANGFVALEEEGDGRYGSGPDLIYEEGESTELTAEIDGETSRAVVTAPPPADVDVPLDHPLGAPLELSVVGQDLDRLLVVVIDLATQEVRWSNHPEDAREVYEFSTGNDEQTVEIPGSAFEDPSLYAVGTAGLRDGDPDDFEHANVLLSSYLAGVMVFHPLSTVP